VGCCSVTAAWFCVQLAPSMSLPPAVPGFPYADLGDRQAWWMIAVCGFRCWGSGVMTMRPEWLVKMLGRGHHCCAACVGVAGAGRSFEQNVPAYIASAYAAASLATTLFFWLLLGGLLGFFLSRVGRDAEA
jgi:predicted cobalt transporter CbtA